MTCRVCRREHIDGEAHIWSEAEAAHREALRQLPVSDGLAAQREAIRAAWGAVEPSASSASSATEAACERCAVLEAEIERLRAGHREYRRRPTAPRQARARPEESAQDQWLSVEEFRRRRAPKSTEDRA